MSENADRKPSRPKPDHEAIAAIHAAAPNAIDDDAQDAGRDEPDETPTTVTFLGPQAAERLKRQQEKRSDS